MKPLPLSILFVERDAVASRALRLELRRRGAHVRAANGASRAIMLADDALPDLVVLDEELDADGLAEALRLRNPEAEFIVIGGSSMHAGSGYLLSAARPASTSMLVDIIDRAYPGRIDAAASEQGTPVVCVDDDPRYLRSISRYLTERGYRPHVYEQATQALDALGEVRPALALVDVMMPGMDGLDLAHEIRARSHGRIPVVLLTGLARGEVAADTRGTGASLFLEKAGDPGDLARALELFAGPPKEVP